MNSDSYAIHTNDALLCCRSDLWRSFKVLSEALELWFWYIDILCFFGAADRLRQEIEIMYTGWRGYPLAMSAASIDYNICLCAAPPRTERLSPWFYDSRGARGESGFKSWNHTSTTIPPSNAISKTLQVLICGDAYVRVLFRNTVYFLFVQMW